MKLFNIGVELDEMQRAQEMGRRVVLSEKAPLINTKTKEQRDVPVVLYIVVSDLMDDAIRNLLNERFPKTEPELN